MFVKSEPSPSFRQFSCKIFLRNHFFFKFALSIDAGETHTHPIILVDRREPILSAIQGVPNAIWDTSCKSRHSSFLARNANENPSSETSRPLATSSLARPLSGLTYSTLKFMRSTCGKSRVYGTANKFFLNKLFVVMHWVSGRTFSTLFTLELDNLSALYWFNLSWNHFSWWNFHLMIHHSCQFDSYFSNIWATLLQVHQEHLLHIVNNMNFILIGCHPCCVNSSTLVSKQYRQVFCSLIYTTFLPKFEVFI